MRDPRRIYSFCNELANIWATECPDLRFGQLVENVFAEIRDKDKDPFYFEEDEMLGYFRKYFKENGYN